MKIIAEHLAKNGVLYYFADDRKIYKKNKDGDLEVIDLKAKDLTEEATNLKAELGPGQSDVIEKDSDDLER